jgi:glycine/D-amino acid oxidase-like deaminating enzyme
MGELSRVIDGDTRWDGEADVVVVGASVAGLSTAVFAAEQGASTILLESAAQVGGTGRKAAAWAWIPNNHLMQEKGIADAREDAMAYLARFARPALYEHDHPTLGLPAWEHELLEAFVDNGADAMRALVAMGALSVMHADDYPNYYAHHEIDRVPYGRVLIPQLPDGEPGDGVEFTRRMELAARERGVDIRTGHPVEGVLINAAGEVVGVGVPGGIRIRARRGVVFCTGGFSHNEELRRTYLAGLLVPGCSVQTNQGVLVEVARRVGAPLMHMNAAYLSPIELEWVLADDPDIGGLFITPGDSMIVVNRHGRRIGNEKTSYNDRTLPQLVFDVERAEYGNLLTFAVWDARADALWAGTPYGFIPAAGADRSRVIRGDTLADLAEAIEARLASLGAAARGIRLDPGFLGALRAQIERFNDQARAGHDDDFRRGDAQIDRFFHGPAIDNPYPNPTMHPISDSGPYFSSIIAPSAIETKGGPRATAGGEILGADDRPIPGLYGVGSCVASPTGQAYLSGGITFGPYITFGRLAARAVAAAPVKEPVAQRAAVISSR